MRSERDKRYLLGKTLSARGYVGSFFDVLALDAKNNLDGRIAASSPFVRALKAKLGVKVTCRASWW